MIGVLLLILVDRMLSVLVDSLQRLTKPFHIHRVYVSFILTEQDIPQLFNTETVFRLIL